MKPLLRHRLSILPTDHGFNSYISHGCVERCSQCVADLPELSGSLPTDAAGCSFCHSPVAGLEPCRFSEGRFDPDRGTGWAWPTRGFIALPYSPQFPPVVMSSQVRLCKRWKVCCAQNRINSWPRISPQTATMEIEDKRPGRPSQPGFSSSARVWLQSF